MGRTQSGHGGEPLDVSGFQVEEMATHRREEADGTPVDPLEMTEEQRQTHQVSRTKLVGKTLEGHGNSMDDSGPGKILLEFVDVRPELLNLAVLGFGYTPDEQRDAHPVLGECRRHRLTQEDTPLTGNLKTPVNRVVIGEGDEVHPGKAELGKQLLGVRDTRRNGEPAKQPLRGAEAVSCVEMEVCAGHGCQQRPCS